MKNSKAKFYSFKNTFHILREMCIKNSELFYCQSSDFISFVSLSVLSEVRIQIFTKINQESRHDPLGSFNYCSYSSLRVFRGVFLHVIFYEQYEWELTDLKHPVYIVCLFKHMNMLLAVLLIFWPQLYLCGKHPCLPEQQYNIHPSII